MARQATNKLLQKAKKSKSDEFYTQLCDIESELQHYANCFVDKVVYCNCDDSQVSNFFRYFKDNFQRLGLRKLIASCFCDAEIDHSNANTIQSAYYCEYEGDNIPMKVVTFEGNGDFRSTECVELLQQADIVVTNPPFSLFREYVAQLIENDKKFVVVGHQNAITYKEIFPLIKDNKLWLGYGFKGGAGHFINEHYEDYATATDHKEGMIRVSGVHWFTNLEINKRHEDLILYKNYTKEEYPKYDNYDAIEVSKTKDIPMDYDGVMGVPITFMDKYNPDQFEILGATESEGKGFSNGLWDETSKVAQPLINQNRVYKRIFIRNKKVQK